MAGLGRRGVSRLRAGTGILLLTLSLVECTPDPRRIARRALEGTVSIEARDQQGDTIATGSGFIVAPGIITTNLHVLEGAWSASVRRVPSAESSEAGRRLRDAAYPADGLAGMDRSHDLALIAIGAMQHGVLPLGEASRLAIGDTVFAVGNPHRRTAPLARRLASQDNVSYRATTLIRSTARASSSEHPPTS